MKCKKEVQQMMRAKAPTKKEIEQVHIKFPPGTIIAAGLGKATGLIIAHSIVREHSCKFGLVPDAWTMTMLIDGRIITCYDSVQFLEYCVSLEGKC